MRILLAEDEPRISKGIALKIEKLAPFCEIVAIANNGVEALAFAEQYLPELVITDIKMPHMDGLELAKRLKDLLPQIRVVILSGYSDFSFAQSAIRYGVFNYLLKPLEDDRLLEMLEELQAELEKEKRQRRPNVLISNQVFANPRGQRNNEEHTQYVLLLVCFFNLCSNDEDKKLLDYYRETIEIINWTEIIELSGLGNYEWIVSDDWAPNQKNILITCKNEGNNTVMEWASALQKSILHKYPNLWLSLCCHHVLLHESELSVVAKRMRRIFEKEIVVTVPRIFLLEKDEHVQTDDIMVNEMFQRVDWNVKALLKTMNFQATQVIMQEVFDFALQKQFPQRQLLKILDYIMERLVAGLSGEITAVCSQLQLELYRTISISNSMNEIKNAFCLCIEALFEEYLIPKENRQMRKELLKYIDENYATIDSVEIVAEIFNYNYSYLSRLFKCLTGVSMVKYIKAKRIEKAKILLLENSSLSVSTIGELVGYTDQQYFGRTFKSMTGKTPSEYRTSISQ